MSRHVVVDGSNIATEGRSLPSLQQLNDAVLAWLDENPNDQVTVVVDATFGHRIEDHDRQAFEEARDAGELVTPPAGAIGRGDAFLLRIAEKIDAVVLSNDSFQEFHGEHEWLFTKGRLIGGTPVAGIGWIFTPRTPVRGPKSRDAVRDAKRQKARIGSPEASLPMPVPKAPPPVAKKKEAVAKGPKIDKAVAVALSEVEEPGSKKKKRRRKGGSGGPPAEPINAPLAFIQFIAEHKPGEELEGVVESFSSHGAFVMVGDARCYIPLSAMGDPAPRAARDVLNKGETRTFVLQALDAPRRGIELALPGHAHVAGTPTQETIDAEIGNDPVEDDVEVAAKPKRSRKKAAAVVEPTPAEQPEAAEPAVVEPAPSKRSRKKAAAVVPAAEVLEAAAPPPAAAATKRSRKKAAPAVEPVAQDEQSAETPAPPSTRRSRKAAAAAAAAESAAAEAADVAPAVKPAKATKKAAKKGATPVDLVPEVAPEAPAKRSRTKKAADVVAVEPEAAPTKRSRKKAAAAAAAPATEDVLPVVEPTPEPAKRSRKKSVPAPAETPAETPAAPARRATKSTKKQGATPAATDTAVADPAVPAPTKRSRAKKAAPPA